MSEKIEAITSVTEFFTSLVENAEKIPGLKTITEHMPGIPLASVVLKQLNQALKEKDPERLGFHALTIAYQETAQEAVRIVGPPRNVPTFGSRPQLLEKLKSLEPAQTGLLRTFSLDRPMLTRSCGRPTRSSKKSPALRLYDREWRLRVTHVREISRR